MTVRDRERKADLVMRVTTRRGRLRRLPRGLEEMAEMVMTPNHQKTLTFSREPYLMLRRSESPMFFFIFVAFPLTAHHFLLRYDEDFGAGSDAFDSDNERADVRIPPLLLISGLVHLSFFFFLLFTQGPKSKEKKEKKRKREESDGEGSDSDGSDESEEEEKPKKKSSKGNEDKKDGKKKKKDPNAPKGVSSAYIFFCNEHRPKLQAEGVSFGEIGKRLGAQYKEITPEEKKVWFLC